MEKTAEQILDEIFYKPETRDWYKPVLKAMELYAAQFHKQETAEPIRLKDLALTNPQWLTILNYTVNDGTVEAERLFRDEDSIEADFLHTKETNQKIARQNAVDLTVRLLREGRVIHFKNGSEKDIESFSPPLYDKYYRNAVQTAVQDTQEKPDFEEIARSLHPDSSIEKAVFDGPHRLNHNSPSYEADQWRIETSRIDVAKALEYFWNNYVQKGKPE